MRTGNYISGKLMLLVMLLFVSNILIAEDAFPEIKRISCTNSQKNFGSLVHYGAMGNPEAVGYEIKLPESENTSQYNDIEIEWEKNSPNGLMIMDGCATLFLPDHALHNNLKISAQISRPESTDKKLINSYFTLTTYKIAAMLQPDNITIYEDGFTHTKQLDVKDISLEVPYTGLYFTGEKKANHKSTYGWSWRVFPIESSHLPLIDFRPEVKVKGKYQLSGNLKGVPLGDFDEKTSLLGSLFNFIILPPVISKIVNIKVINPVSKTHWISNITAISKLEFNTRKEINEVGISEKEPQIIDFSKLSDKVKFRSGNHTYRGQIEIGADFKIIDKGICNEATLKLTEVPPDSPEESNKLSITIITPPPVFVPQKNR